MTSDIQDTTLYWELLDLLPPDVQDAHGYIADWIGKHADSDLTAEQQSSFQAGYREWKEASSERNASHVERCRERLMKAFASENYGGDLVSDMTDVFEEEDECGNNLMACMVKYWLDAPIGDEFALNCFKEFKCLRANAGAEWMVRVCDHANRDGQSAWSIIQTIKGERRKQLRITLDPASPHRHPSNKYCDAERRLCDWCEVLNERTAKRARIHS